MNRENVKVCKEAFSLTNNNCAEIESIEQPKSTISPGAPRNQTKPFPANFSTRESSAKSLLVISCKFVVASCSMLFSGAIYNFLRLCDALCFVDAMQ